MATRRSKSLPRLSLVPKLPWLASILRRDRAALRSFGGFAFAPLAVAATVLLFVVASQLVVPGGRSASTPPRPELRDDFVARIDDARWTLMTEGVGPNIAWSNGRVELNIPADAREAPTSRMAASLSPQNCVARGDYVVSVDYELLDWPPLNGTDLILHEVPPPDAGIDASISRFQNGEVESVMGHSQVNANTVQVAGTTGSLRLARRGTRVTASYRVGNGPWKDIPVAIPSLDDATFRIWFVTDQFHFGHQTVRVAVDNFRLTATELTCG